MDSLISVLGSALVECGKCLCGPAYSKMNQTFRFKSNVDTLDKSMKTLLDMKTNIEEEIESAEKQGKSRTPQIKMWLRKVEEIKPDVASLQAKVTENEQKLHGCCFSCSLLYKLGKQVVEKLEQVKEIMNESTSLPVVMVDSRVKAVERLPGPSVMNQPTAKQSLDKIMDLLSNDKVGTIGMLGMGGVGKTTLIRNLNNELESRNSAQPFSFVVWVTVSKDLDLGRIQDRLAERLNMTKIVGESMEGKAARLFNRLEMEKKFIVILDDVWERIDLDKIGIPRPKFKTGSKVILTTRSLDVCREMESEVEFTVAVLTNQESWDLFHESAGATVNSDEVRPLAEKVAKECGGLPLALITVGRAMRGKTKIELWKNALRALQRSNPVPHIKGIEKEVFLPLKWSYDSLEGNNIKPCFLYCCLYPEDFSIDVNELLQCWIAEGLIDRQQNHEDLYNMGISLIENLKDSFLLETGHREGTLRMHDVVRDVAVWIASFEEDGHKSLIQSGFGLNHVPEVETWGPYNRVSLMYNRIEKLPDHVPNCSQISTLFLQGNAQLQNVSFEFLRGFQALRVLNLSDTSIVSLPLMEHLELRAIFLRNCLCLSKYPTFSWFSDLQVLDLSGTLIELSPHQASVLFNELSFQEQLLEFYVDLHHVPSITLEESSWLKRLRRFIIRIGSTTDVYITPHNERTLILCGTTYFNKEISVLWSNATAVVLVRCQCITEMWTGVSVFGLDGFKSLTVDNCSWTGSMETNDAQHEVVLLPNLHLLSLHCVTNLISISSLLINSGGKIRIIEIDNCHEVTYLFPVGLLHKLQSLEKIVVNSCDNLIEIITDGKVPCSLPNLRIIKLKELPKLKRVSEQVMLSPCLKQVEVSVCPLLKKLPLSSKHANKMEVIKGELDWWNQVQCEDEDTKSSLQKCFQLL